jgi:hypothetical protein
MAELRRTAAMKRESLPGTLVSLRSPHRPHSALNSASGRREAERVEKICLALAANPVLSAAHCQPRLSVQRDHDERLSIESNCPYRVGDATVGSNAAASLGPAGNLHNRGGHSLHIAGMNQLS